MRKGIASTTVIVLGALIILSFSAYIAWNLIAGKQFQKPPVDSPSTTNPTGTCIINSQCDNNPGGSVCITVSDPYFSERVYSFCGCETNERCQSTSNVVRSGVCGKDNRC